MGRLLKSNSELSLEDLSKLIESVILFLYFFNEKEVVMKTIFYIEKNNVTK